MKRAFGILIVLFLAVNLTAQEFEIPENYVLATTEDYAKYEKDIIASTIWMENTPLDKNENKRKEVNGFFMEWLTGCSTVSVNLNADYVMKYTEKNPELLMIFLAGWTRYVLENDYSKDPYKGYFAGYKSIINVYKKGKGINKNQDLEKLIKVYDKGNLEKWIAENIIL
ncbi:MAG: hypothetical protein RBS19_02525 [Bacteroidales bacterium]|nr:hypothetical protein [Bacteroidales bacterium]MDY0215810.1 hypothetical protein [Bacteroidales bacterium]